MLKEKVEGVLEKIRAGLNTEGGDIELVDIRDSVIYVRLKGACGKGSVATVSGWPPRCCCLAFP